MSSKNKSKRLFLSTNEADKMSCKTILPFMQALRLNGHCIETVGYHRSVREQGVAVLLENVDQKDVARLFNKVKAAFPRVNCGFIEDAGEKGKCVLEYLGVGKCVG